MLNMSSIRGIMGSFGDDWPQETAQSLRLAWGLNPSVMTHQPRKVSSTTEGQVTELVNKSANPQSTIYIRNNVLFSQIL